MAENPSLAVKTVGHSLSTRGGKNLCDLRIKLSELASLIGKVYINKIIWNCDVCQGRTNAHGDVENKATEVTVSVDKVAICTASTTTVVCPQWRVKRTFW